MASESINATRVHRLADSGPVLGSYASATDLIGEMYGQDVDML